MRLVVSSEQGVAGTHANIHAFLRAGSASHERIQVGPFLIRLTPNTKHAMLNYAVPDDDVRPSETEVEALIAAFQERDLLPRLEYVSGEAPALGGILLAAGFCAEAHLPIMTCRPGEEHLIEPPPDIELVLASSDEEHIDAIAVANEAYGEATGPPDRNLTEGRRRGVQEGGAVVLARHVPSMAPAGTGLFPVPREGVRNWPQSALRTPFARGEWLRQLRRGWSIWHSILEFTSFGSLPST